MKTIKIILSMATLAVMTGCASVKYTKNPDGTEKFHYIRFGKQKIGKFGMDKATGNISFEGQEADSGTAFINMSEAMLNMSRKGMIP